MKAFVGHSFDSRDKAIVTTFKEYFDALKKNMNFSWEAAVEVEVKGLSKKIQEKMEGKDLFIGILTKDHLEIEENALSRPWIFGRKNKYIAEQRDLWGGASSWIIQESGYAIGKGMSVLFLLEETVRKSEGLHADAQYIPFISGRETESFKSIAEALGNMVKQMEGLKETPKTAEILPQPQAETAPSTGKVSEINGKEASEHKDDKTEQDYIFEAYTFLRDKEDKKFENLKKEIFDKYKIDKEETINWQARILHFESVFASKSVLNELKSLQKENPDNRYIHYSIGHELENYGSYAEAALEYIKSVESSEPNRLYRLFLASKAYAKAKDRDKALNILLDELKEDSPQDEKYLKYTYLCDVAKIITEDDLFVSFAEKALSLNPANNTLRFDLALKYSNLNKSALSLYHNKILTLNSPKSAYLNNQGVNYSNLEMSAKAVEFYKKSAELEDSSTAMGNLAQKLLNGGFLEEAEEKIKKAMGFKGYEKSDIDKPLARISSIAKDEEEKEIKALESIKQERQFNIDYADAYSISSAVSNGMNGEWTSRHGLLHITLESGNVLVGQKEEFVSASGALNSFMGNTLASGSGLFPAAGAKETLTKKTITFKGNIVKNRIINYSITIEIQPTHQYLLPKITEFSGVGIIDKGLGIIKVMEFDGDKNKSLLESAGDKKQSFYEFRKKSDK